MNENELRTRLDEAAAHMALSPHASRRVVRRARVRMAATAVATVAACLLVGLGAAAALDAVRKPDASPANPSPRTSLEEKIGVLIGGRLDGGTRWWLVVRRRDEARRCLGVQVGTSTVYDCVPLGVPSDSDLGFYEWHRARPGRERYEIVGLVAPEVARVDVHVDGETVPARVAHSVTPKAFVAFLPVDATGYVVARDGAGEVVAREELCLPPRRRGMSCNVSAGSVGATVRGRVEPGVRAPEPRADPPPRPSGSRR